MSETHKCPQCDFRTTRAGPLASHINYKHKGKKGEKSSGKEPSVTASVTIDTGIDWPKPPELGKPAEAPKTGILPTSGIWDMGAACANPFLPPEHKIRITEEQRQQMDHNLRGVIGDKAVSPMTGLIIGIIGIFVVPFIAAYAGKLVEKLMAKLDEKKKKKGEKDGETVGTDDSKKPGV